MTEFAGMHSGDAGRGSPIHRKAAAALEENFASLGFKVNEGTALRLFYWNKDQKNYACDPQAIGVRNTSPGALEL